MKNANNKNRASSTDTIAAIATAPGKGGVGIVRISGPAAATIAQRMLDQLPKPRYAAFLPFYDAEHDVIDEGIALYFKAPNSFTGEDVLELQGHGGPLVLDRLLQAALQGGARLARPGEFSERAFLNGKMDLAQAEAVADLINATSHQAARSAVRSLQGEFSAKINSLLASLIQLRMYVEAAIDFPEEDIDFIAESSVKTDLENLMTDIQQILAMAQQGMLLQEGITVVIAGKPNAGKSSLLNCLSGRETAIVSEIAGTTRDIIREYINIDGLPLHIIDTAGLRETEDLVEKEGVRRALAEIEKADLLLQVVDAKDDDQQLFLPPNLFEKISTLPRILIVNKIDLLEEAPALDEEKRVVKISAKHSAGISLLKQLLKQLVGYEQQTTEGNFIARRRHVDALERSLAAMQKGSRQLEQYRASELLAEDLRDAQQALNEITGEFSADDLLGVIFSQFCIGK